MMNSSPQLSQRRVPISMKPADVSRLLLFNATAFIALPTSMGKSSVSFGPYPKTNPQNGEDHKGDPRRQQMNCCRNHQNECEQQSHIGPIDAILGGHDTCPPLRSRSRGQFTLSGPPLFRLRLHILRPSGLCGFRNSIRSSSPSARLSALPHLRGLAGNLRSHQASRKLFSVGPVIHLGSPAPRNAFRSSSAWETMMTSSPVGRRSRRTSVQTRPAIPGRSNALS